MELLTKLSEQIVFKAKRVIKELRLIVLVESTDEEILYQPLQTNNHWFEFPVSFLTGYNGVFNITNKMIEVSFTTSYIDDCFILIIILSGVHELASLNDEIKRIFNEDGYFTEENDPIVVEPENSTLGSTIGRKTILIGSQVGFTPDDTLRDFSGFEPVVLYEKENLSCHSFDIFSFDNSLHQTDTAQ